MASKLHSEASLGARHPIHDFNTPTISSRDGLSLDSGDVGKVVKVDSPLSFWIIANNSPEQFVLLGDLLDPVSGTEYDTGRERDGSRVYRQRFAGTMGVGSVSLIGSGVDHVVSWWGWFSSGTHRYTFDASTALVTVRVNISTGEMEVLNTGTLFDSNAYDIVVDYVKS